MKKIVMLVAAVSVILVAGPALADHSNNNPNGQGHQGQGGQGGNGGNGGQGGSVHHNSTVTNTNQNVNQNTNRNDNTNVNVNRNRNRQNQSQGQSQGQIGINKQGQSLTNQPNQTIEGDNVKVYAPAPSVFGPGLAAANCMGSWSVGMSGGNGIVGSGLGFGATKESVECNRRAYADQLFKLAQEYKNPRFAAAGLALMANNKEVKQALIEVGILEAEAAVETSTKTTSAFDAQADYLKSLER